MKLERLSDSFVPGEGENHDTPYVNLMGVSRRELSTLRVGLRAVLRELDADCSSCATAEELARWKKYLNAALTDLSKYV